MKSVNEIKQILPNHERIFYIGNGIDTQRFRKINYQKENTNIIIGFVGRKEPTKNLKVLIYALHNVLKIKRNTKKTISLKLIGPHPNHSYLSELISLVNQLGLNDNVEFIDKIQRIEEVYNILDLFILPSFVEGTSNSLLEAMACEKICLVSEGADSDNILEKRFVFKNEDVSELSQKIEIFLQLSPEENRTIGENNRRKVVQNFSIDMLLRKYTELWSQS
jgi:glycosyltransferase involved in cell wall biosynthesis